MHARNAAVVRGLVGLAVTLWAGISAGAEATERFLCRADHATGFVRQDDAWKPVSPGVADRLYVVSPMEVFDGRYAVTRLGKDAPLYYCESDEAEPSKVLRCGMRKMEFVIDLEAGRFQHIVGHGYVDPPVPPDEGPTIEIGRCFAFR